MEDRSGTAGSYRSKGTDGVDEEGRAILGGSGVHAPHVGQEGVGLEEGERVCVPCEETAHKFGYQAIASNGRPRPGRNMDRTIVPGIVVELAYPGVTQATGGGNQ